ncbi:uncharacterized protein LOC124915228 [Impatiens glandulifera]|uniref:uncharacterized protein LOC124915228 n=1 Tax=Impatiens glandulifera TaxID=253017 RepID=UPI001FB11B03|nr:uncharacterized protein LOC124915228 [Impatiens glandulifera]
MELTLRLLPIASLSNKQRLCKVQDGYTTYGMMNYHSCFPVKSKSSIVSSALLETVASVAIAATVVGTAASILIKRTKASEVNENPTRECEACGGSGICPSCKGEGFVVKRLTDENAEKARLNAKNMATRYTAALPKKWSYCSKCTSSRSCTTCDGSGKISL